MAANFLTRELYLPPLNFSSERVETLVIVDGFFR